MKLMMVNPRQGKELIEHNGIGILDVRTPGEFAAGHIAGARNIDVLSPDFKDRIGKLPKNRPYFMYCRSGNRTRPATSIMENTGFSELYVLEGGILSWIHEGYPVA